MTILNKERRLGTVGVCGGDPVVAPHLRNTADYHLPTFIFLAGLTILKKERCLGRLSGWGVDPVVALHLKNAADYHLPTFGPHGTKLGHS